MPMRVGPALGRVLRAPGGVVAKTTYRAAVLATNPVGYWRLGEASGASAANEMGANAGVYYGSPTLGAPGLLTGDSNTAMTLDGGGHFMYLTDSAPFRFADQAPFSCAVWFQHTADAAYRGVFFCGNASFFGWGVKSQSGLFSFERTSAAGQLDYVYDGSLAGAGVVFVVATYDGTTMRFYKNGALNGTPAASSRALPSDSTLYFGYCGALFNGTLDEAAVWDRALTQAEITTLYAIGAGL